MKKFLISTALLLTTAMGAWADVLPTETLQASYNLPVGTPEHQFYIRGTKTDGQYWTATSVNTNDKNSAGKFAFYAVPGLTNCYYIYNVDQNKWLNYSGARDNTKSFASLADNFNANAYWEITSSTLKGTTTPCYQLRPTTGNQNPAIKSDRYANWYQGTDGSTIGLWQEGPGDDAGSAWSLEAVEADNTIKMNQEIALAKKILDAKGYAYTKGDGILTSENVESIMSSPYSQSDEGSIAGLVDGATSGGSNFWHSAWGGGNVDAGTHYIVATIPAADVPELMSFSYKRRSDADNDHTTRWAVYGVPADETGITDASRNGLTLLAVINTPFTAKTDVFENLPAFETKGFNKFRFYSDEAKSNRGYFHIGEFQLYGMTADEANDADLKTLAAAVKTAEANTNPTQEDINALKSLNATFTATDAEKAAAQALLNLTGVGYPAATAEARVALAEALAGEVTSLDLENLVAAYKACTEVALPEAGKAYSFAFVDKNGNEYKIGYDGTTLSGNAADAAAFYCQKFTNVDGQERYAFIANDGKFLAYRTVKDSYTTHVNADKRLQTDFLVASMVGSTSDYIQADQKEVLFGTVYLKVNNRTLLEPQNAGSFVLKLADKSFDKTVDPYFNDDFVSAIKVTEVTEYTASDAVQVAASTINPLVDGYKHPFGSGLNQYVATFKSTEYTDFNSLETAIKAETSAIADGAVTYTINVPSGKAFKVKTNQTSARFLSLKDVEAGNNAKIVSGEENADIFLLTSDNKMVSYTAGLGLADAEKVAAPGTTINTMTFGNGANIGCYSINTDRDNEWSYLYWNDNEDLLSWNEKIGNTDWTLTEVTALPIAMNEVDGIYWATFNAPVSVVIPAGLKAYSAAVDGDVLNLTKVAEDAVLAANTPVILYSEANVENLTISAEAGNAANENALSGTNQKIISPEGVNYVLGNKNGIGFYKYTAANVPAFKAYLNMAAVEAPAFSFSFSDVETAIKAIESENSKAVIYDIAGRRVQRAAKGLYIVNGKKVMFK